MIFTNNNNAIYGNKIISAAIDIYSCKIKIITL